LTSQTHIGGTKDVALSGWRLRLLAALIGAAAGTLYSIFAFNLLILTEIDSLAKWVTQYLPNLAASFFVALFGAPIGILVGLLTLLLMGAAMRFAPSLWRERPGLVGGASAVIVCTLLQIIFLVNFDYPERYSTEGWPWILGMWALFLGIPTILATLIGVCTGKLIQRRNSPIQ